MFSGPFPEHRVRCLLRVTAEPLLTQTASACRAGHVLRGGLSVTLWGQRRPICTAWAAASRSHWVCRGLSRLHGLPTWTPGRGSGALRWFLSRGDNPGAEARFPHRLPVLPDPLSTSSSLSSVSRTRGKLWRLKCTCVLWAPHRPNRRRNKHLIVVKLDAVPEDVWKLLSAENWTLGVDCSDWMSKA